MTPLLRHLWFALVAALALAACSSPEQSSETAKGPLILAAASLQEALEDAADGWADQGHPRPVLSFAATSALARQIQSGAPADIFISADSEWMDTLDADGRIVPETRRIVATNRLVLIAPKDAAVDISLTAPDALIAALGDSRLAMAEPEAVPAGRYARAALTSLNAWDRVRGRITASDSVRSALALVERGEAPLGIVYRTDALASDKVRIVGDFPEAGHAPIVYPAAVLKSGEHAEATDFLSYLLSKDGQARLARHGFAPAPVEQAAAP